MHMSDAIRGYNISSLAEGFSPTTLTVYNSALRTKIEFIGDKEVEDITTDDLRSFMNYLLTDYKSERINNPNSDKPLSTASHHRYWKAMRSFFNWAERDLGTRRPDKAIKCPSGKTR